MSPCRDWLKGGIGLSWLELRESVGILMRASTELGIQVAVLLGWEGSDYVRSTTRTC
jgi:hypothetical protein